jgi:flagellar assembly factor FliW
MTATTTFRTLPALLVTFPTGFPGLPGARRFQLGPLGHGEPNAFGRLVSVDPVTLRDGQEVTGVGVTVSATGLLWPDLSVDIDDNAEAILELDHAEDAVMLAVVTLRRPIETSTANLFAPIVVNVRRGLGLQFVPNATEGTVGRYIHTPLPLSASSR